MCSLIEDWVLIAASAFSFLWYIVLVKVYKEENLASHRFKVGEGKEYFNSFFSGNCGFSSLIKLYLALLADFECTLIAGTTIIIPAIKWVA